MVAAAPVTDFIGTAGYGEPMGKRGRYHGLPLSLCLRDGLQVILF